VTNIAKVIFVCTTCSHINNMNLGMPGYNLAWTTFESFSDAWQHMFDNRNHHIEAKIKNSE
jgi:hypothetical protein